MRALHRSVPAPADLGVGVIGVPAAVQTDVFADGQVQMVEYDVTVSERFPKYEELLPVEARTKLFYADRAELIFPDGQVEIVKGGKRRKTPR